MNSYVIEVRVSPLEESLLQKVFVIIKGEYHGFIIPLRSREANSTKSFIEPVCEPIIWYALVGMATKFNCMKKFYSTAYCDGLIEKITSLL